MKDDNNLNLNPGSEPVLQTIGQALEYCFDALHSSDAFYGHGTDNPWDEAVQLVLSVSDLPLDADDGVLPHPLSKDAFASIKQLLKKRIEGHIPLPYLLGKAWFAGLEFGCDERAIIPRSPIAELIRHDYQPWYLGHEPQRLLDLCCGSGCIGLAAAHYQPQLKVDLVDLDPKALALARENTSRMGFQGRVELIESNLFAGVQGRRYDLILSNPPYVDASDLAAMPEEYQHEPELALGSGDDGLFLSRQILVQAGNYLRDEGLLILEVGNSWEALERAFPDVPFTWLEFEQGGHGVLALNAQELQDYSLSLGG